MALNGRKPEELALPYELDIDPFTATAQLRIQVPVPPGRAGRAPSLTLGYSSSAASSPIGAGWNLTWAPPIGLYGREHLPRWDGLDGVQLNGAELVPWLVDGQPRQETRGPWSVTMLRPRRGTLQCRVERWVDSQTGRTHYRSRDASNLLTIYGARTGTLGRIADDADEARTLTWLPEIQIDSHGNAIWFEYASEDDRGVDRAAPSEPAQTPRTQRYLKRILYGNVSPLVLDDAILAGTLPVQLRWCFQIVVDYGDHGEEAALPDRDWLARPDPFTTCRAGFPVRTHRLCRRILSFHHFEELGPDPVLVGALSLEHELGPSAATVRSIEYTAFRIDDGIRTQRSLPPLRFAYSTPAIDEAFTPQRAVENLPAGLGRSSMLVDLFGDGLPGLLTERDRAWHYKRNLGGGRFAPLETLVEKPAMRARELALVDRDGDGDLDVMRSAGRMAGEYSYDRDLQTWRPWRAYEQIPHVEGRAQWLDLNGDGRPDLVVPRQDALIWYASTRDGFADPVAIPRPDANDDSPIIAANPALDLFFADMNGDGLVDLVRIQNGRIVYWPSLGNGRFGDAVVMDGAPMLDAHGELDSNRVRFVDLDGSGTADLLYLGRGEITCWMNTAGNGWIPGPALGGLPYFDRLSDLAVVDLLGDHRPCLVWSTPLPGRETPLEYLPLSTSLQPGLLLSVDDSMGSVIEIGYSTSAAHYLRDLEQGRAWSTHLPRNTIVADRRTIHDQIADTRTTTRLEYHDGFFDSAEREIRGFAHVDRYDVAVAEVSEDGGVAVTPSLTRVWFHLGTEMWNHHRPHEIYEPAPVVPPHVLEGTTGLSAVGADDALRGLAGHQIRREIWASDADGRPIGAPFHVESTSYRVRHVHGVDHDRSVWSVSRAENLIVHYEQTAGDPRIEHQITIDVDDYDMTTRSASVAYGRSTPVDVPAQTRDLVTLAEHRVVHIDDSDHFQLAVSIEGKRYELGGIARGVDDRIGVRELVASDVAAAVAAPVRFHEELAGSPGARLVSWSRSFYWNAARTAALPLGEVSPVPFAHHDETACFTTELVGSALGAHASELDLSTLGYAFSDDHWWTSDPTREYTPPSQFSLRLGATRSDGSTSHVEYDAYALVPVAQIDPSGGRVEVAIDYHLLAPWRAIDANGLVTETRFDPLGVAIATTQRGTIGNSAWGFDALATVVPRTPASLAELIADPGTFLQGAASFTYYDLDAWQRDGTPPAIASVVRDQLCRDAEGELATIAPSVTLVYLDGSRRVLQTKHAAGSGPAIQRASDGSVVVDAGGRPVEAEAVMRWRVSGGVAYDARGQHSRVFEPYFSPASAYEPDMQRLGASTLTLYDALGREVARHFADGSVATMTYRAWSVESADANDTVATSSYRALRQGLPVDAPERAALEHALRHAGTTSFTFFDAFGRPCGTLVRGGDAGDRRTETTLDIDGNARRVIDARGLVAITNIIDMRGTALFGHSIDAGDSWQFSDALGRPVRHWNAHGIASVRAFDEHDRPTALVVDGQEVASWQYGDTLPLGDPRRQNAHGRVVSTHDASGDTTFAHDPRGLVVRSELQLEGGEAFVTTATYDAFGRCRRDVLADGTMRSFSYTPQGMGRVAVTTPDGTLTDLAVIDDSTRDARGNQTNLRLGNGVELAYAYDATTGRLATQTAARGTRRYQAIEYTYDPIGNITRLHDRAHEGPGALVASAAPLRRDFSYDAHYRLTRDTGRVHQALVAGDLVVSNHLHLNNGDAVETYTREYTYDLGGNLTQLRHVAPSRSWTTDFWISPTSNRSLPALDANGNAVQDPEGKFDAAGNVRELAHLRSLEWSSHGAIERAVLVHREGGTDDDERYVYAQDGTRVIKRTTRVVQGGQIEVVEKLYLGDSERKRVLRDGVVVLERWTTMVGSTAGATLYRWSVDTFGRETDDVTVSKVHYRLPTHQGSTSIELDPAGELISYEEYFSHGSTAFVVGSDARGVARKDYRYCGKECDAATGLYYYGLRYYAPWLCRWLSPDPAGAVEDLNLYQFVLGDPVGRVDPDGTEGGVPTTLGVVSSKDKRTAIAQFNSHDGLLLGIQVLDAEFKDNNWYIKSARPLGMSREERLKAYMTDMVGGLQEALHAPTGDGTGTGTPDDGHEPEDPKGEKGASLEGGGFDDVAIKGNDKPGHKEGTGYFGEGTGMGVDGNGLDAAGAHDKGPSDGGSASVEGSGTGEKLGKATGDGAGLGKSGDGIGAKAGAGTTGDPSKVGKPGAGRGGDGKKPGKPSDKQAPPKQKIGNATVPGTGTAPPTPGGGGEAPQGKPGGTGTGTAEGGAPNGTEGGTLDGGAMPYAGNSRTGTIDGDNKAVKPGDPRGSSSGTSEGHLGGSKNGDPEGMPGGTKDGWPNGEPDGSENGSMNGVPGCGGDYIPPDWLAPWLQAAAKLPQLISGPLEVAGGVALLLAPEPTMATKVAGIALILHGLDTTWANMNGQRTYTAQGIERGAVAVGVPKREARIIGDVGDIVIPLAIGYGATKLGSAPGAAMRSATTGESVVARGVGAEANLASGASNEARSLSAAAAGDPALAPGRWVPVTRPDSNAIRMQAYWADAEFGRAGDFTTRPGKIVVQEFETGGLKFDGADMDRWGNLRSLDEFKSSYQGSIRSGNWGVARRLRSQADAQLRIADDLGVAMRWHVPANELNEFQNVLGRARTRLITWVPY